MKKNLSNSLALAKLCLLVICGCFSFASFGQVTTELPFPNGDQEINIIFDLKLAKDSKVKGLLGKKDDVYLWSGAGTTATGDAFEYKPTGQSDFAKPFEKGKMTSLGDDKWSIKLTPRTYYGVPADKSIKRLGVLLKSGDGQAQTEDFFLTIFDKKLNVVFNSPKDKTTILRTEENVLIDLTVSEKAKLSLSYKVDNGLETNYQNITDSTTKFSVTVPYSFFKSKAGSTIKFMATAVNKSGTTTEDISFVVPPTVPVQNLPANVNDGINYQSDTKVTLALFAPKKQFIYVIGDFNNWQASANYLMKKTPDGNRFWLDIEGLEKGKEYAFQYLIDGVLTTGDPYCEKILDPKNDKGIPASTYPDLKTLPASVTSIASVLQTGQTPYNWKVKDFKRPANTDLVIYELHIRDFVGTQSFKTVTDTLSYLKRLGVNAIELMPIQEFSNNDSWGYNPIYYFAPDKAYGTKNDVKAFVDKCHENGIAVILDVVYNQADYEFPYVKMYWDGSKPSTESPFFNPDATHPFNVFFDFNHESPATINYVTRANDFWLKEYKIDGYRFDLAKGFTQKKTSGDNEFRLLDDGRVKTWKNYYDNIRKTDASAYVILELFSEDKEEKVFTDYGMMVWGNQNGDFRGAVKGFSGGFNRLSYKERGFTLPHVVGYMESHDEERIVFDAVKNGRASVQSLATVLERCKAAASMFFAVPGPKMIWQFGELGYDISIDQNGRTGKKPILWNYQAEPARQKLYKVYAELIKLRKTQPAFQTTDFEMNTGLLIKQIVLNHPSMQVNVVANFDENERTLDKAFPKAGKWYDYFTGAEVNVPDATIPVTFKPGEFHIFTSKALPKPEADLVTWKVPNQYVVTAIDGLEKETINVYPNPVSDYLKIDFTNTQKSYQVFDLQGNSVSEERNIDRNSQHQIDVQNLPIGTYLLRVKGNEKEIKTVKFIKN
jgi:glycosidase